jgi:next to BRCA1 gene 1 protein
MASTKPTTAPTTSVNGDTLVVVKILYAAQNRRFKIALRDLGPHVLPQKVCATLTLQPDKHVTTCFIHN